MTDSNDLADGVWPYRSETPTYRQIPQDAVDRADVYELLRRISRREDAIGDAGRVSGSLYGGDHDHWPGRCEGSTNG